MDLLAQVENVRRAFAQAENPPNQADTPAVPLETEDMLERLLQPSPRFSPHWLDVFQGKRELDTQKTVRDLYLVPNFESRTRIRFKRVGLDGKITNMEEYTAPPQDGSAANSLSMTRAMGPQKDFVRGGTGKLPFTPGGLEITVDLQKQPLHTDAKGLLDVAPGLDRGVQFETATVGAETLRSLESMDNAADGDAEPEALDAQEDITIKFDGDATKITEIDGSMDVDKYAEIDSLLPDQVTFARTSQVVAAPRAKVWAHMVDVNQKMEDFNVLVPDPARTWPFELDNFQKEAVYHLEQGDSVFVAAHTSAGKTVIAEYAMSLAKKHMTKCIYTSPIKALSNQKYRDFSKEYEDVGILTGDVQLNPEASTLIMTTEILRSMLYRGADILRDVEYVIFDEVHYVNDSDRGVVWEEVIIMLPDHVKFILLSATVPNTFEFASWVGRTKQKDIYVISTPKRPVPLTNYLWAKKNLYEIVGPDRKFNEAGWAACNNALAPKQKPDASSQGNDRGNPNARSGTRRGRGGAQRGGASSAQMALKKAQGPQKGRMNSNTLGKTDLLDLVHYLNKESLLPAVVFVFSRKMTEQHAMGLRSVNLTSGREKSEVHMFIDQAVSRLRPEDRDLPQIEMLREFLTRGVGVHHSGLLPIMKEVVEILFARGLVKLLFATETFAMGLNLPTRTVVFTAIRKFDSKSMRALTPGEYTQMAGRAGRRGLDKVGTVIIMNAGDAAIPQSVLTSTILGTPTKLSSQFRLTYTMILSLLRIEAVKVEDVIQQSFSENATHVLRPEQEKQIVQLEKTLEQLRASSGNIPDEMFEFERYAREYATLTRQIYETHFAIRYFSPNYVVFREGDGSRSVGLVQSRGRDPVSVLLVTKLPRKSTSTQQIEKLPFLPFMPSYNRLFDFLPKTPMRGFSNCQVPVANIEFILSTTASKSLWKSKDKTENMALIQTGAQEALSEPLQEIGVSKLKSIDARKAVKDRETVITKLEAFSESLFKLPQFKELYSKAHDIAKVQSQIDALRTAVTLMNTELLPDYEQRIGVLRSGNYIDESLNVLLKGRVACEISTGFELYVTELLLDNFFSTYEPEEMVALLSAFVFEGARGVDDSQSVTPKIDLGKEKILDIVNYVHGLADEHQVTLTQDEADFAEKGRFALMAPVYEWARGMSFYEITQLTDVQEGTIVRVISRLDEVCRAVASAARIMGDVVLYDKVSTARELIKRDIVFCSSLYL